MPLRHFSSLLLVTFAVGCLLNLSASAEDLPAIPPIQRLLPPPGIEVPEEVRKELETKLSELAPRIQRLTDKQHRPDIEIFAKAVGFALRFDEFYDKKDFDKARWALKQTEERLELAEKGEFPWTKQTGLVVRGYRSSIDDSIQPYGLVIPDKHDFDKPYPLYVFLHGRGDKETDLHFLYGRARSKGEIVPDNAIVVHPFGRQCIGFKSAGEIDVLEVVAHVQQQYETTQQRALVGFSMGGAGAWHLGAHYPDMWSVVSPGAGFVDVARYQKLKPANYPPVYEQKLWGVYDVPAYTRNLFNVPVIAYSGELDKQKDAADYMAEMFKKEGRELTHLIGPGTEHKYHPETKRELLARLNKILADEDDIAPQSYVQTRTLNYSAGNWLSAFGLEEHWQDARLDGHFRDGHYDITTKNVTRLQVRLGIASQPGKTPTFTIDGQTLKEQPLPVDIPFAHFERRDGKWQPTSPFFGLHRERYGLCKWPKLQGPIDDAFMDRFLVVLPSGQAAHPRVQQWIDFELAHLRERWGALFRGEVLVKKDSEVTAADMQTHNLICFGDGQSNQLIRQALPSLPIAWTKDKLELRGQAYDSATHLPVLIYPNPLQPPRTRQRKYIVLNSGPTFREAHDRTNSLQNPKLPDWAIIDITTPPDGEKPGKVVAADFFDEQWQVKKK